MKLIKSLLLIFLTLNTSIAWSQTIKNIGWVPFIQNYTAEEYNAGRQNWSVIEDNNGLLYFANNSSAILVYDGSNWSQIPVPNTSIFSLNIDYNGTIYVGAKNNLGYLKQDKDGNLVFESLLDKLPDKTINFEKIWQIEQAKDSSLVFLSNSYLLFYKNDTFDVLNVDDISSKSLFLRMFKVNGEIYVTVKYRGLYRLDNHKLKFIPGSGDLWDAMGVLPYLDNKILIYTWYKGFYLYDNNRFKKITTPIDSVTSKKVYKTLAFKDKYYAFALSGGGVLITDKSLRAIQFINSKTGLYNDNILSLYLDSQDNLWLGLDNGLASVYLFSPFTLFGNAYGFKKASKIYSVQLFDDTLYVANSSGLYWRRFTSYEDKTKPIVRFQPIKNPRGDSKTYIVKRVGDRLMCASDLGLYEVKNGVVRYLSNDRTIRNFIRIKRDTNVILGVEDGLFLFRKRKDGKWHFEGNVANFDNTVRYIAEDPNGYIWASEKTWGVFKIKLNKTYDTVVSYTLYNEKNGLHGLPAQYKNYVFKIKDNVVFGTSKGIYVYNEAKDRFEPYQELNRAIGDTFPITMVYEDTHNNIWFKQEVLLSQNKKIWELGLLKKTDTGYTLVKAPFYPFRNKIFSFTQIDDYSYIIGSENGFIHYDSRIRSKYNVPYNAFIRTVKLIVPDSVIYYGYSPQKVSGKNDLPVIDYKYNDFRFVFAANYYRDPKHLKFSYFLEGNDETWSQWTEEKVKEYSNLRPGTYTFYVKAKNIYGIESSPAKFSFVVKPPWYLTYWAMVLYFVLAGLLIWLIVYLYTLRLRKQKEYLEQVVKERTIEIEKQRDILAKKNDEIEKKNKDITSSIEYAKRIQTAILPLEQTISKFLPEHFILFKPRDIVSGDFYWFAEKNGKIIIAAVDCTGHGVPGAFMSMIGYEILNTIVINHGITDPAEILTLQNKYIRTALKQDTTDNQDGMDMALCVISEDRKTVEFAGAKNPLIYIKDNKLYKVKGNRQSIGGYQYKAIAEFTKHVIEVESPMWFYIFSDGYQDQFGDNPPRKFMAKYFYDLLFKIHKLPMDEQLKMLDETIVKWQNGHSQTDDILVIGFKL